MRIELFSAPGCSYCESAKALCERLEVDYMVRDIQHSDSDRRELLRRLPSARALPQIFIDGQHVGGYEDLKLLAERGFFDRSGTGD